MAKEKDFIFKEVSAKEGSNVNDLFYVEIFDKISKKFGLGESNEEESTQNPESNNSQSKGGMKISNLKDNNKNKKDKKKCCK